MRVKRNTVGLLSTIIALGTPYLVVGSAYAASAGAAAPVQGFIKSVIQVLAGLAGLVAAGFFVVGGFGYITSSGNPEHLDKSKRTLLYSAIGLSVTVAAFVLSNIVDGLATSAFGS